MAIDISGCLTAIQNIKSKVANCFVACSNKGSTFSGTETLSNLESAISLIPTGKSGLLPDGYTQLEYIESTGTQYIDTGFKPNQDTRVVAEVELKIDGNNYFLFGARYSTSNNSTTAATFGFNAYQTFYRTHYRDGYSDFASAVSYDGKFTIDKNKNVTTLNDKEVITRTYTTFSAPCNMVIFAVNTNGKVGTYGKAKVYSFKIYDNGTLVRDFIPCKNPSGVVGLYDLVNDKFYPNSGTGTFIAGAVVQGLDGASFGGFDISYGDNTYTIDFGGIGVGWKSIVCYSDTKDGHFAIHKTSATKCVICASVFYDASNSYDEAYGIFPDQRGTYRATYIVSGNSITFTNAEYDGTSNGFDSYTTFSDMPKQVSTDVNSYFTNQYKLDKITVVF